MSYIDRINAFWSMQEISRLSAGQIALWFALLDINRKYDGAEWFSVSVTTLQNKTGISSQDTIYRARERFKQLGYIDFEQSDDCTPARYKILDKIVQGAVQATKHTKEG